MAEKKDESKNRVLFVKVEPSFEQRVQRVADERYGTNKSLLVRRAVERLIEPIEAEMDTNGKVAA